MAVKIDIMVPDEESDTADAALRLIVAALDAADISHKVESAGWFMSSGHVTGYHIVLGESTLGR